MNEEEAERIATTIRASLPPPAYLSAAVGRRRPRMPAPTRRSVEALPEPSPSVGPLSPLNPIELSALHTHQLSLAAAASR
eukprot:CAMPEP_0185163008 /NCGR_PEP_ID=MMETSP1139-20130426/7374_1 /TAXON_ID=298111 /ORGANISM="Pavlova sp., Strain CCMP459" /LENGTH=79 /DNA_ID=CAMNT_0027728353 /DNA_START=40 /DNA_END=276 /DNA_ORIENTATION=+